MATLINSVLIDINISFICRNTHKYKNGENPIILRVIYRQQRRDIFTGLTCQKEDWISFLRNVHADNKLNRPRHFLAALNNDRTRTLHEWYCPSAHLLRNDYARRV